MGIQQMRLIMNLICFADLIYLVRESHVFEPFSQRFYVFHLLDLLSIVSLWLAEYTDGKLEIYIVFNLAPTVTCKGEFEGYG